MARDVIFGKGRGWRPDDQEYRRLRLGPGRGASVGDYASAEPGEYSDSYYGPGDAYPQRVDPSEGYTRDHYDPHPDLIVPQGAEAPMRRGGVGEQVGPNYVGYGRLRRGARSWADLGVHSVPTAAESPAPSFRGRGPKGYVRTDERLRELVCERLTDDPDVDATEVEVQVQNGEIILTGRVRERRMKWRAEDEAQDCAPGAVVHNRLRVQRSDLP